MTQDPRENSRAPPAEESSEKWKAEWTPPPDLALIPTISSQSKIWVTLWICTCCDWKPGCGGSDIAGGLDFKEDSQQAFLNLYLFIICIFSLLFFIHSAVCPQKNSLKKKKKQSSEMHVKGIFLFLWIGRRGGWGTQSYWVVDLWAGSRPALCWHSTPPQPSVTSPHLSGPCFCVFPQVSVGSQSICCLHFGQDQEKTSRISSPLLSKLTVLN